MTDDTRTASPITRTPEVLQARTALLTAIAECLKNGDFSRSEAEAQVSCLLTDIGTEAERRIGQATSREPRPGRAPSKAPAKRPVDTPAQSRPKRAQDLQATPPIRTSVPDGNRLNDHPAAATLKSTQPPIILGCAEDCDQLHNIRRGSQLSGFSVKHLYKLMADGLLPYEEKAVGRQVIRQIRHSKLRAVEQTRRPFR
jgi:hypothetical protein